MKIGDVDSGSIVMHFLFVDDRYGSTRLDMWLATVVSLLVSYLLSIIALLTALGLSGWDLAGGLVVAVAIPIVLGFGLFCLFQPLKNRDHFGHRS